MFDSLPCPLGRQLRSDRLQIVALIIFWRRQQPSYCNPIALSRNYNIIIFILIYTNSGEWSESKEHNYAWKIGNDFETENRKGKAEVIHAGTC